MHTVIQAFPRMCWEMHKQHKRNDIISTGKLQAK